MAEGRGSFSCPAVCTLTISAHLREPDVPIKWHKNQNQDRSYSCKRVRVSLSVLANSVLPIFSIYFGASVKISSLRCRASGRQYVSMWARNATGEKGFVGSN